MAKNIEVLINKSPIRYSIEIENGVLEKLPSLLTKKLHLKKDETVKIFLITHLHLYTLYGQKLQKALTEEGFQVFVEYSAVGESVKSWLNAEKLLNKMIDLKLSRSGIVMALGGGIIGDLAGFVSSIYQRGLKFVQVPTSLLSMVDASVGGKVAVNLGVAGKNLIGSFYQPSLVVADLDTLKSLPESEWRFGLSEVIKYSLLKEDGGIFYRWLEENKVAILKRSDNSVIEYLVAECIKTKVHFVSKDEMETTDIRIMLNLGHTFGHSLEAASRYRISHGEAVAMGISLAGRLALKLNKINGATFEQIINILNLFNLPNHIDKKYDFNTSQLIRHFEYDKKNEGTGVKFIIPSKFIGHCEVVKGVSEKILEEVFAESIY
jgi:3-dehydroquinate synthase